MQIPLILEIETFGVFFMGLQKRPNYCAINKTSAPLQLIHKIPIKSRRTYNNYPDLDYIIVSNYLII